MSERHDVTLGNGQKVTVTADPDSPSYIQALARSIITEVGENPLRSAASAGSLIYGAISHRRGKLDSARIAKLEESMAQILKKL